MERDADGFLIMDEPPAVSTKYDGREWALEVPQQPVRARMCGFGDKVCDGCFKINRIADILQDRRPITPPPCVKLIVKDPVTGREIDAQ
jgi:Velvet factor